MKTPELDSLISYLLDEFPDDRILCENPYAQECPVYWPAVCRAICRQEAS
jgi:hypothetical protein